MAAAAAYAALVSLMNVLTRYQHPTCPVPFDQSQMQTLLDKVTSLVDFLEIYYQTTRSRGRIQGLEWKMTSAAQAAEDLIETSYVDRVLKRDGLELCPDLHKSILEMDRIIQDSMDVGVKRHKKDHQEEGGSNLKDPSVSRPREKNIMLGFDDQLSRLMDQIRSHHSSRRIISIVGMGGIGKTTLATNVYNHSYVTRHFDIRSWVTISQHYDVKDIIIPLLRGINVGGNDQMNNEQLGDRLHKSLWGRKYLIVIDDVWSNEAWNEIRRFFPDNANGSRILLTTRLWSVADSVGSSSTYQMQFLDNDKSLNLLSETVYGRQVFPSELETFGKAIAKSCKGLPLAIVVIGGLLKMSSQKTPEYFSDVAKNVSSIISTENDGHCLEILSLSYNHLPIHLKPCFLYMASFKEDHQISVSDLVKLWVADGLLKPTKDSILEEVALKYLNNLIGRNLIMVGKKGITGRIETCTMHDLLREFCLREAQSDKFLCLIEEDTLNLPQKLESERRLAYNSSKHGSYPSLPSMPHARSFIGDTWSSTQLASGCGLLRVLHISYGFELPVDFVQLINIRHLAFRVHYLIPSLLLPSLSLFWNLETLILEDVSGNNYHNFILPSEIWEFLNLRHLEFKLTVAFPDPRGGQNKCVLNNLRTIITLGYFYCTDEVLRLIPNLKELNFFYDMDDEVEVSKLSCCFTNLARFCKLEILSVSAHFEGKPKICVFNKPQSLVFSPNLRELALSGSGIPWENMSIIGSLPNLEVLNLEWNAFRGEEWNSVDGEFERLKHLSIFYCDLDTWNAESCHFPRLEHLELVGLGLKEIPQGIGEVSSLESILLNTRKMSAVTSAKEILDEQQNQGNDDLLLKGTYWGKLKEKAELEKWAEGDKNFQIKFAVSF